MTPPLLRPIMHWVIPSCIRLRQGVRDAKRLIDPIVEIRKKKAEEVLQAGKKPPKDADAITWMTEVARGRNVDYVGCQLSLSLLAIFSTAEIATRCVLQLCETPEIVQPLRDEVIAVLKADGWAKTTLSKMKLMDSFLKEIQRFRALDLSEYKHILNSFKESQY